MLTFDSGIGSPDSLLIALNKMVGKIWLARAPRLRWKTPRFLVRLVLGAICATPIPSVAQVPPHYPGTICMTPSFWCWAPVAGPPGGQCACPSAYGWIYGRLV
jgi:hypothetical protein